MVIDTGHQLQRRSQVSATRSPGDCTHHLGSAHHFVRRSDDRHLVKHNRGGHARAVAGRGTTSEVEGRASRSRRSSSCPRPPANCTNGQYPLHCLRQGRTVRLIQPMSRRRRDHHRKITDIATDMIDTETSDLTAKGKRPRSLSDPEGAVRSVPTDVAFPAAGRILV
jgi:hypothetical protein